MSGTGSAFRPWFERYSGRLDEEKRAYDDAGLAFTLNKLTLEKHSIVVFEGTIRAVGAEHQLQVVYPSGFHFVRPEVICTGSLLQRHQNPIERNLCLLPNDDAEWRTTDHGALLVERAIRLLELDREGPAAIAAQEVEAPEPRSVWYPYTDGTSFIVLEEPPVLPCGDCGEFRMLVNDPYEDSLQAFLIHVGFRNKTPPWKLEHPDVLPKSGLQIPGVWYRCPREDRPPFANIRDDQTACSEYLAFLRSRGDKPRYLLDKLCQKGAAAFALVYDDEGPCRGEYSQNWLVGLPSPKGALHLLRPCFFTASDQFRRIPSLLGLASKKVAVVGLGALGSTVVLSLARAGVGKFLVLDHDVVEPGPLVRQAFDLRDVGLPKTAALRHRIQMLNPRAVIEYIPRFQVGGPILGSEIAKVDRDPLTFLADTVAGADLLVSLAGRNSIDYLINEIGAALGIARLFGWVTNGAWGGRVFRAEVGHACFECLARWLESGHDLPLNDDPSAEPVFARGCGFASFTGTGFDIEAVANLITRLAIQSLTAGEANAYPQTPENLLTWNNRGADCNTYPSIAHSSVPRQDDCWTCQSYRA